jgi:N-acetylmuramoyl-L-alanine amidase
VVVATAASMSLAAPASAGTHLVRSGETLSSIANRYDVPLKALARINHLRDPNLIVAGTRLRISGRARVASIHVVRAGETLSGIAARYGTTVSALARVNRLRDPNLIVAGARLRVPPGGGVATSPSAPTPSASSVAGSLQNQSVAHGVDPALVKAVAWQESGWNQAARSSVGAIGVMQVMPGTAQYINDVLGGHNLEVRKADDNVHLGVMYLRHMLGMMKNRARALAAYYSGPGNVKGRLNEGQRAYVRSVKALVERFR